MGNIDDMGWYGGNSSIAGERVIHPVGEKAPNDFGLRDMHGNVTEFCEDAYEADFYDSPAAVELDPLNASSFGSRVERVNRGGDWDASAWNCRSAMRRGFNPRGAGSQHGFRPVARSR